jgi:hypothetical protein
VGEVGFTDFVCQLLNVVASEFGINARLARAHEFVLKVVGVNHALTFPNEVLTA